MKIYLKLLLILVIFITLAAGVGIWYLAQLDFNRYIPKIQEFLKDKWPENVLYFVSCVAISDLFNVDLDCFTIWSLFHH